MVGKSFEGRFAAIDLTWLKSRCFRAANSLGPQGQRGPRMSRAWLAVDANGYDFPIISVALGKNPKLCCLVSLRGKLRRQVDCIRPRVYEGRCTFVDRGSQVHQTKKDANCAGFCRRRKDSRVDRRGPEGGSTSILCGHAVDPTSEGRCVGGVVDSNR